jgi:hypothetical protein
MLLPFFLCICKISVGARFITPYSPETGNGMVP